MSAQADFEEQATGWLALFWNDNGNVSVCKVVFDNLRQAKAWAEATLRRSGATKLKTLAREVKTASGYEMGYRFIPVLVADPDTAGADISQDHIETIR